MSKKRFIIFVIFILLLSISVRYHANSKDHVFAIQEGLYIGGDDEGEEDEDAEELADEIKELEEKIEELQGAEKTLQNEIAYFNSQINLIQLKIQNAVAEITKRTNILENLKDDISELEFRIEKMSESIDYQEDVLDERMRARYKTQSLSPALLLLHSTSFSDVIRRVKYLKTLQYNDQKLLDEMKKAKDAYNQQKDLFEEKKAQTEEIKQNVEAERANLVAYRVDLDDQKAAKQDLLEKTQNDEAKFQKMLEDAKRELAQIVNAASVLQSTEPGDVDKGDIVGIQGNTGYSFGDHLHFGVYKYDNIDDIAGWDWYNSNSVDPEDVLEEKKVYWNTGCSNPGYKNFGDGDWEWPMSSPVVSQDYGHTCYSDTYYGGKDHPAIDMYGNVGAPIKAVEDGKAYFCRNCLGDGGNGVFIFHDNGYMTLYWHLQ